MKVLQIINSLNTGGAEKLLLDSIPIYINKGIDMELLLLNGNETPFLKLLNKQGIKIHSLTKGKIKKVYNPFLAFRIIPYLKRYDIVHVHLFPSLYWVALAKIVLLIQTKFIFTEHNTNNTRIEKGGIWRLMDKLIYKQYNKIISITAEVNIIIKRHLSEKSNKFSIINNGIDLSEFSALHSFYSGIEHDNNEAIKIIQVAGFREQKDQPTLIKALQYLPDNVCLFLVGDGETRPQCEQLVEELKLSNRVSFLGIRTDVPQLLKASDIVVLSSHWEGLSLSSIEAMASGKPFIASNVPGLKDIVEGAALLFTHKNEKDLAEKITSLISSPELYKKVSAACLERSKQYDINIMVDKYIEVYKEVLRD